MFPKNTLLLTLASFYRRTGKLLYLHVKYSIPGLIIWFAEPYVSQNLSNLFTWSACCVVLRGLTFIRPEVNKRYLYINCRRSKSRRCMCRSIFEKHV